MGAEHDAGYDELVDQLVGELGLAGAGKVTAALVNDRRGAQRLSEEALAPSTRTHREKHWPVFVRWCESVGVDPLEADERIVCAFLHSLLAEGTSYSRLRNHYGAIGWGRKTSGASDVTDTQLVRRFMAAAQRHLGKDADRTRQSVAFTNEQLEQMAADLKVNTSDHAEIRCARNRAVTAVARAAGGVWHQVPQAGGLAATGEITMWRWMTAAWVLRESSQSLARIVTPGARITLDDGRRMFHVPDSPSGRRRGQQVEFRATGQRWCPTVVLERLDALSAGRELFLQTGDPTGPRDRHPAYQRIWTQLRARCKEVGITGPEAIAAADDATFNALLDQIAAHHGGMPAARDEEGWTIGLPDLDAKRRTGAPARVIRLRPDGTRECPVAALDAYVAVLHSHGVDPVMMPLLFGVSTRHGKKDILSGDGSDALNLRISICREIVAAAERAGVDADDAILGDADGLFERLWDHLDPQHTLRTRTKAHLLCGIAVGARHSTFENCHVEDTVEKPSGYDVFARKEKQDQPGEGRWLRIRHSSGGCKVTCPACALRDWLDLRGDQPGPLFVSLDSVGKPKSAAVGSTDAAAQLKAAAKAVGVEGRVGTHSEKRTHVTLRAQAGDSIEQIAADVDTTPTVLIEHYIKPSDPFATAVPLDPSERR